MKTIFKARAAALALVAGLGFAPVAQAAPVIELALLIDGSGSIIGSDFTLQKNAYINALTNVLPITGQVAIGVWQFGGVAGSGNTGQVPLVQQVFGMQTIDDATDKNNLLAAINGMIQIGAATPIGPAIDVARQALLTFLGDGAAGSVKEIIDVSTDGIGNLDPNGDLDNTYHITAANNAIAGGIDQVNCIGVGTGASCDFETGAGSFQLLADSFAEFQTALETKLRLETGQVPEPAALAMLGLGLAGLGALRRRKAA